jgi:hypothetical protein
MMARINHMAHKMISELKHSRSIRAIAYTFLVTAVFFITACQDIPIASNPPKLTGDFSAVNPQIKLAKVENVANQQDIQETGVRFEHISLEEGLSQSVVTNILQDEKGFLWFGTQDGLNRFDGYEFKIFKFDPEDPFSISHNFIISMVEDPSGVIWFGTNGGASTNTIQKLGSSLDTNMIRKTRTASTATWLMRYT